MMTAPAIRGRMNDKCVERTALWSDILADLVGRGASCHSIEIKGHRRRCFQGVSVKPMCHRVGLDTPAVRRLNIQDDNRLTNEFQH